MWWSKTPLWYKLMSKANVYRRISREQTFNSMERTNRHAVATARSGGVYSLPVSNPCIILVLLLILDGHSDFPIVLIVIIIVVIVVIVVLVVKPGRKK